MTLMDSRSGRAVVRCLFLAVILTATCLRAQSASASADMERRHRIERTMKLIESECATYGNGDWGQWLQRTAPFRAELAEKLRRCPADRPLLYAPGDPILFEACEDAIYLQDAGEIESWVKQKTVVSTVASVSKWLKKKGIDLVFVPVPKVAEVYPDRLVSATPPERLAAPHMRRLLLEMCKADIEVVDLLPEFLSAREKSGEPLFLPHDSHWSPRGQRIASLAIADRLKRYTFVRAALSKPSLYREVQVQLPFVGCWRGWITPVQFRQISQYIEKVPVPQILMTQGAPYRAVDSSPVLIIGDSYAVHIGALAGPGSALDAVLSRDLNLPVSNRGASAMVAAHVVKDFIREPELLDGRKVIVWITRSCQLWNNQAWPALPLPD